MKFTVFMAVFALIGWGSFISIVQLTSPSDGLAVIFLFYLSLGMGIFSSLSLAIFSLGKWFSGLGYGVALHALKQGFILTLFLIGLLILQSLGILNVFIGGLLFLLVVGIGLYLSFR